MGESQPHAWSPSALSTRERARSSDTYRTWRFRFAISNLQMAWSAAARASRSLARALFALQVGEHCRYQ